MYKHIKGLVIVVSNEVYDWSDSGDKLHSHCVSLQ